MKWHEYDGAENRKRIAHVAEIVPDITQHLGCLQNQGRELLLPPE